MKHGPAPDHAPEYGDKGCGPGGDDPYAQAAPDDEVVAHGQEVGGGVVVLVLSFVAAHMAQVGEVDAGAEPEPPKSVGEAQVHGHGAYLQGGGRPPPMGDLAVVEPQLDAEVQPEAPAPTGAGPDNL